MAKKAGFTEEISGAGKTKNISIVLAGPQSSGNIGSVARAMKNTGFTRLVLVNPCEYKNNEGFSMACNAAPMLLDAPVYHALEEGVKGSALVAGATRRVGKTRYPLLTLYEALPKIMEMSQRNNVSIVFGREDKGLMNEEIALCDILFEIPAHADYPSLNLSHAVFIVCHAVFMAGNYRGPTIQAAPREEVEKMYAHMEKALKALDYGEKGGEGLLRTILRSFRRLLGRTGLMQKEVNMLRGIFTQIEERVNKKT